jgi:inner membrane transporter RhtA
MSTQIPAGALSRLPAPFLVLTAVVSVQYGAALARDLFPVIGAGGAVFLRLLIAVLCLSAIFRPNIVALYRQHFRIMALFGICIACSTLFFSLAVQRIPLGIAVAIEFIGPLVVAVRNSRTWLDRMWIGIAALSIALLVPDIGVHLDIWGVVAALVAALFWGLYIVTSPRVAKVASAYDGLIGGLIVALIIMSIPGILQGGWQLLSPNIIWHGFLMAIAAAIIPFTFEYNALQRLPARTYGVLVCSEPVVGAIIGWLVLHESLNTNAIIAIIGITIASLGSILTNKEESHA